MPGSCNRPVTRSGNGISGHFPFPIMIVSSLHSQQKVILPLVIFSDRINIQDIPFTNTLADIFRRRARPRSWAGGENGFEDVTGQLKAASRGPVKGGQPYLASDGSFQRSLQDTKFTVTAY